MKKLSLILLASLMGFSVSQAEPYFAFRTGLKCSQCHINKTGGGKRTSFGVAFAQGQLSANHLVGDDEDLFDGRINDYVSVGGNYRVEEQLDFAYRESGENLASGRDRIVTEGNLYFQFDLISDRLSFYWDADIKSAVSTRELFAILNYENFFVKYGTILLPYGLRVLDDDELAFIRSETGYNYGRSDLGAEFGYESGPFSFVANYTIDNGSAIAQFIQPSWRIGFSSGTDFKSNRLFVPKDLKKDFEVGIFSGFGIGSFTLFGEYDHIVKKDIKEQVWFIEADWEVVKGINLKAIHEAHQPDISVDLARNLNVRYIGGVEYFPNPYLNLSLLGRIKSGIPANGKANQDDIIVRLHLFM